MTASDLPDDVWRTSTLAIIDEDRGDALLAQFVPEVAADETDNPRYWRAAHAILDAVRSGRPDVARRYARVLELLWGFGDDDVQVDILMGVEFELKDRLAEDPSLAPGVERALSPAQWARVRYPIVPDVRDAAEPDGASALLSRALSISPDHRVFVTMAAALGTAGRDWIHRSDEPVAALGLAGLSELQLQIAEAHAAVQDGSSAWSADALLRALRETARRYGCDIPLNFAFWQAHDRVDGAKGD